MIARARLALVTALALLGCEESLGPPETAAFLEASPDALLLTVATESTLAVVVRDAQGERLPAYPVIWSSSDTSVVTVSRAGIVTGRAPGAATVRAIASGVTDSVLVLVPAPLVAVSVTPLRGSVLPGGSLQLAAALQDSSGGVTHWSAVPWVSADTAIARVSPLGVVSGVAVGVTTVSATVGGQTGAATVEVVAPVASITVTPNVLVIVPSGVVTLRATAIDSGGDTLRERSIAWRISDTAVASVSAGGVVTGRASGFSIVRAVSGGGSGEAAVTVRTVTFTTLDVSDFGVVCGVASDSVAFCWHGRSAELGTPAITDGVTPIGVATSERFVAVSGGEGFACGLAFNGSPYCWGYQGQGRLGNGYGSGTSYTPVPVAGGLSLVTVSAGHSHACGVTPTGDAYCWGSNGSGELGTGTTVLRSLVPVAVSGGVKLRSISAGLNATCAVAVDSIAYCWGENYRGQLGTGDSARRNVPTAVAGSLRFRSLHTASEHSCGIATTGVTYCWGNNREGALGTGDTVGSPIPVPVSGGWTFTSVSPGGGHGIEEHTCGIIDTGVAYCWGNNIWGQLGTGNTARALSPTAVSGGLSFRSISAGAYTTCGITTSNVTYCWGELFPLDSITTQVPTKVGGQP